MNTTCISMECFLLNLYNKHNNIPKENVVMPRMSILGPVGDVLKYNLDETEIKVELLDKEGNIINELKSSIKPLNPGETTQFNVNITTDVAGAYNFRISK